jgi:predicted GNAT family acetyltransferase
MIRLLTEKDRKSVLEYLYKDLSFNIFPIGDIEAFGFDKKFQRIYADFDEDNNYLSVFLRYKEHAVFSSHTSIFNQDYLTIFKNDSFESFSGKEETINLIKPFLKQFNYRKMYFCEAKTIKHKLDINPNYIKEVKTKKECEMLFDLLSKIKEFGYVKITKKQFVENKLLSIEMGKTFYIKEDDKIVSSVAVTAETTKNAMVVAVATDENYRGRGYATLLLLNLMDIYINQKKKQLCLFYDNPSAGKIYLRLGFDNIGLWTMSDRKNK